MDSYLKSLASTAPPPGAGIGNRVSFPIGSAQEAKFSGPPGNFPYGARPTETTMANYQYDRVSSGFDDKAPLSNQEREALVKQHSELQKQSNIPENTTPSQIAPTTPSTATNLANDAGKSLLTSTTGKAVATGLGAAAAATAIVASPTQRTKVDDGLVVDKPPSKPSAPDKVPSSDPPKIPIDVPKTGTKTTPSSAVVPGHVDSTFPVPGQVYSGRYPYFIKKKKFSLKNFPSLV